MLINATYLDILASNIGWAHTQNDPCKATDCIVV